MLSRAEQRLLYRRGVSGYHDHWFYSLLAGEPFFEDGLLAYFDGRLLTVCGFPLRDAPRPEAAGVRDLVERWAGEKGAEAVAYLGPEPVNLGHLADLGFRRIALARRTPASAELWLDSDPGAWSATTCRAERRARSTAYRVRVRTGGAVTAMHLRLIEDFYREGLTPYLAELVFALPAVLRARRVRIIDAWSAGRLHGFVVAHRPFADALVGLFLVHDRESASVSDFLYCQMLALARRLGAAKVNVGQSPTAGHYSFKRKWGGRPCVPPCYGVEWARGHLARRCYVSWAPRTAGLRA